MPRTKEAAPISTSSTYLSQYHCSHVIQLLCPLDRCLKSTRTDKLKRPWSHVTRAVRTGPPHVHQVRLIESSTIWYDQKLKIPRGRMGGMLLGQVSTTSRYGGRFAAPLIYCVDTVPVPIPLQITTEIKILLWWNLRTLSRREQAKNQ